MSKQITTIIRDFSGGMTNDFRSEIANVYALSYHFSLAEKKLIPKRAYTILTDGSEKITRFAYAKNDGGATYVIYGLGQTAEGCPKVFKKTPNATVWTSITEGSTGDVAQNVFFHYKNYLYCWEAGTKLSRLGPLITSPTFANYQSINYTNVAQPIHHPADDCAYFFQDNCVHRLNNATFDGGGTTPVLTFPDNMKIIGGAPYGDYLGILCSPVSAGTTETILYLWDRDSSLSTISAKINLGYGEGKYIGNDNMGVFVVQIINSLSSLGGYNNGMIVKYYNGSLIEKRISDDSTNAYFYDINADVVPPIGNSVSVNNAFYFPVRMVTTKDVITYHFILKAQIADGRIILTANQNIEDVVINQHINGIFELTEFWLVSHSAFVNLQTKSTGACQEAAVETIIYSLGDSSVKKKLIGVTVMTSPLVGQIVLKYRKDEETAWIAIFTNATANSISHSAINIESSGATLPEFKEIQFRIESTNGAEIIGLKFKCESLEKDAY